MGTRREVLFALGGALLATAACALADRGPALGSVAIDWNSVAAKPTLTGSVRTFLRSRTATLDELEVHVTTLNPGQAPHPPHRHPNEEMLIVKQGEIEALINGAWKRVGPGSIVFFASNQWHGVRNPGSVPAVYHVISFRTGETPAGPTQLQPVGVAPK